MYLFFVTKVLEINKVEVEVDILSSLNLIFSSFLCFLLFQAKTTNFCIIFQASIFGREGTVFSC